MINKECKSPCLCNVCLMARDEEIRRVRKENISKNNMTNEEIMKTLRDRGRFRTAQEVDEFFLECLNAKDQQHLDEMRRLIESVPNTFIDFQQMYLSPGQWKTEQFKKLNQLTNDH